MKRILCIFFSFFLLMGLLPASISSAHAAGSEKLLVNGVDLVSDADHSVDCPDGSAVYDPVTQTLTLTDAAITLPSDPSRCAGIYIYGFTGTINIELVGENSIDLVDTTYDNNGIWNDSNAALVIKGDGSLCVQTYNDYSPFGIWCRNASLTIQDAELSFSLASGSKSNGFLVDTNASITLDGARLTATGYAQGLFAGSSLYIQNQSVVNIRSIENALYSDGNISIENSRVEAMGMNFSAICAWGNISLSNATVSASSTYDNGIYCYGLVTVSGGKTSISSEENDAFRANGGITIKKMSTVRTANYTRADRTAIGHEIKVRYIASITI